MFKKIGIHYSQRFKSHILLDSQFVFFEAVVSLFYIEKLAWISRVVKLDDRRVMRLLHEKKALDNTTRYTLNAALS